MTKVREIYRCPICGNIVEVLHKGAVLSCCGQPMQLMDENSTDGAVEKHVPVLEAVDGGYRVRVGSAEHPMTPAHYIEWIELLTPTCVMRRELTPDDKPEALFLLDGDCMGGDVACGAAAGDSGCGVSARAYCNLHGLWAKKI